MNIQGFRRGLSVEIGRLILPCHVSTFRGYGRAKALGFEDFHLVAEAEYPVLDLIHSGDRDLEDRRAVGPVGDFLAWMELAVRDPGGDALVEMEDDPLLLGIGLE